LALEVAQQFISLGEAVEFLFMNDTYNLAFGKTLSRPVAVYCNVRFLVRRLARRLVQFTKLPVKEWPTNVRLGLGSLSKHLQRLSATFVSGAQNEAQPKAQGPVLAAGQGKTELVETLERVRDSIQSAVEAYVPSRYPGRIILFRASERMIEPYEDDLLGWGPIADKGVTCEVFEGDHVHLNHNPKFGSTLASLLRQAQEKTGAIHPQMPLLSER
jgi:thioesterase domain-containing protein